MKVLTVLYFDCFSGASGDMILGALIDAGVALEDVRGALGTMSPGTEQAMIELETFCAVAQRIMAKTNASKVASEMRTVEIALRINGRPVIE